MMQGVSIAASGENWTRPSLTPLRNRPATHHWQIAGDAEHEIPIVPAEAVSVACKVQNPETIAEDAGLARAIAIPVSDDGHIAGLSEADVTIRDTAPVAIAA